MTISNEHSLAIGKISVAFANIERSVSFFIWSLIGPEQYIGQMVTAEMSFSRQLDLLSSLFRYRCNDQQKRDELKTLISRLTEIEKQRNTILHSSWIRQSNDSSEATRLKITSKRQKGLSHTKEVVKSKQLETIVNDFQVMYHDIFNYSVNFLIQFTYAQTVAELVKLQQE